MEVFGAQNLATLVQRQVSNEVVYCNTQSAYYWKQIGGIDFLENPRTP